MYTACILKNIVMPKVWKMKDFFEIHGNKYLMVVALSDGFFLSPAGLTSRFSTTTFLK